LLKNAVNVLRGVAFLFENRNQGNDAGIKIGEVASAPFPAPGSG